MTRTHTIRAGMALVISVWAALAFGYRNPLMNVGNAAGYAADPCVLKWMGKYYLYHTDNYHVFESDDLVNWTDRGRWAPTNLLGAFFWAPDPLYFNGVFYMYWSGPGGQHNILTSRSPMGPFQMAVANAHPGIDGSVFMNDNGNLFFTWAGSNGFWYDRMTTPTGFEGSAVHKTSCAVVLSGEGNWTEGPQIVKIDGTVYATYCGTNWQSPTYQVHAAKGATVAGLTAQNNNPIVTNTTGTWTATGHDFVILGPDLMTYYIVYHARSTSPTGDSRKLMVDRMWVDSATEDLRSNGPTFTDQPDPRLPTWSDAFNRASVGPDWLSQGPGTWAITGPQAVRGDSRGQAGWAQLATTTATGNEFAAEFNLRLVDTGTTGSVPRFGVVVGADSAANGLYVFVDPVNNRLSCDAKKDGADLGWINSTLLRSDWDHRQWHTLRIAKLGPDFKVYIDGMRQLSRTLDLPGGRVGFVLDNCAADYSWTAFSNRPAAPPGGMGSQWGTY